VVSKEDIEILKKQKAAKSKETFKTGKKHLAKKLVFFF